MAILSDWVAVRWRLRTMALGCGGARRICGLKVMRWLGGIYRISRVDGSEAVVVGFEEAVIFLLRRDGA